MRAGGRQLVATSAKGEKRGRWRRRGPLAFFVFVCVAALIATVTGAASPVVGTRFALAGHWVYNSVLQVAFHIDGATANIDAEAAVPGDPGSQVVQGDTSGFVVGSSRITEFGKSTLSVEQSTAPPTDEIPAGLEVAGGPYLVYRAAGKVVRLGQPPASLSTGGAVGDPASTSDGTLWFYRIGIGLVCQLSPGADRISSCPVVSPRDHASALTVVGDHPALLDLTAGTVNSIDGDRLGAAVPIGVSVSPTSRPAANDVAGRVAILDPVARHLVLADSKDPTAKPVTVELPDGDYDRPVSTGSAVAVVDRKTGTLRTFGADGTPKETKPVPHESGSPRVSRGEDGRAYVEDSAGTHVLIVGKDGSVADVAVGGKPADKPPASGEVPNPGATQAGEQRTDRPAGPARPGNGNRPTQPQPPPQRKTTTNPPPVNQRPPVQQKPPPIPASPPGAPSSVSATAGDSSATVNWGAAPDNRSPITSYRVSWQGGSTTVNGGALSAKITGLTNGTRYVFTVTAINAMGTGPGASSPAVVPKGAQSITISEGRSMTSSNCKAPDCHAVNVTMTGFAPNTTYTIVLHSNSNNSVWREQQSTDANGNATHNNGDYDVPGETVWVTVSTPNGTVQSNKIKWV